MQQLLLVILVTGERILCDLIHKNSLKGIGRHELHAFTNKNVNKYYYSICSLFLLLNVRLASAHLQSNIRKILPVGAGEMVHWGQKHLSCSQVTRVGPQRPI